MHAADEIPVRHGPESRPKQLPHTAHYRRDRVRQSLTSRVSKFICAIFLGLLFILGLIAFILWLSLRPHRPRFHVRNFSLPGLAQPNGFQNAELIFNVTARNANQNIGIYYDAMDGVVYYRDQKIASTYLLTPFYEEPKNTTVLYADLGGASLTVNSQRWMEFMNDRAMGTVLFRLELTSTIRFKVFSWKTRHHRMHSNCDVAVGQDGMILGTYINKKCPVYFT